MSRAALVCAATLVSASVGCAADAPATIDDRRVSRRVDAAEVTLQEREPDGETLAELDAPGEDSASARDIGGGGRDSSTLDTNPSCPLGHACNPIVIGAFPFSDQRDTAAATSRTLDAYGASCAPATDEGGAEVFYRVDIAHLGLLSLTVDDLPGDQVDVDLHLLTAPEAERCVRRDNKALRWIVRPGRWWIVVDTWVDGDGVEMSGPYTLTATLRPLDAGPCALEERDLRMFWSDCDPAIDCFVGDHEGTPARFLRTPSLGPVVKEAHLVTEGETFDGDGWPSGARDGLARHYQRSEAASAYSMERSEPWAPSGEGGSQWGQGAAPGRPSLEAEAWYVNMYWRSRPPKGTRLLVYDPRSGRAVVAAGGYETGPGSSSAIGGAAEEIHDYLGAHHRSELAMGFLRDQTLPYGPIDCATGAR